MVSKCVECGDRQCQTGVDDQGELRQTCCVCGYVGNPFCVQVSENTVLVPMSPEDAKRVVRGFEPARW